MSMTGAAEAYFERVAGDWDRLRAGYFDEDVRKAAIAHGYLRPEMTVADVGAGTGFIAAGLAPLVSRVYVLDGSAAMLAVAQRNLAGFDNVTIQQTEGHILPLPEAAVDAVFANMYLHHCPDPLAAIREMMRVLKPGGRLVLTDMDAHDQAWMREEMADTWLGFERDQVKGWLREAGLVNVLVSCASQCCAGSETVPGQQAQIDVFVATGTQRVTGARAAVQANYGALAERGGCCAGTSQATTAAPSVGDASCCNGGVSPVAFVADIPLSGSCCAPANAMPQVAGAPDPGIVDWVTGYRPDELATVPSEAVELSLGCGNPGAFASLRPGETVLDIGSGAGLDAFYAGQRVGPAGRVIGVDMTPAMIERARRAAARAGLTNVEFRLGQAEAMPVADKTVDVIMSNCVINLCEDKGRVFEEAFRVLKPGGRLAISDIVADGPLPASLRSDPGEWSGCVSGALPEREYLDLVRGAGFTDVKAARSLSGGQVAGVTVYSLSVGAIKAE